MPKITDPIKIGQMELKNRLIAAPMVINRGTEQGFVTDRLVGFYERKAAGGYSLVQVEASHIRWDDRGFPKMIGIYDDRCIAGLRAITETIHRQGAKCSIQIQHSGRQGRYALTQQTLMAPSETTPKWLNQPTRALTFEECKGVIGDFVAAARRAKASGFDSLLLHGAHGFLLNQFMSPYTNHRKDSYGDPLAFVSEVIQRVKAEVGDNFPVMIRVSGDEFIGDKGYNIDGFCEMAPGLVAAGVDAIDVSAAIFESSERMFPNIYYPRGANVYLAEKIKQSVNVPVITAGRINDPKLARSIIEKGRADIVAVGRQQFADIDFGIKTLKGLDDEVRQCIACDWCTERLFQRYHVECAINYFFTREVEHNEQNLIPANRRKNVLIIGGGVAGLEAARVAGLRGHNVILMEKSGQLGGLVSTVASRIPRLNTRDLANIVNYLVKQLDKIPNVKIELNAEATRETVQERKPDAVVLATGSQPLVPDIQGIAVSSKVITIDDYLSKKLPVGERVVIIGGQHGAEIGVSLAREGKKVTIVEESAVIGLAPYITPLASRHSMLNRFIREEGVNVIQEAALKEITLEGVIVINQDKNQLTVEADTVIIAAHRQPNGALHNELQAIVDDIYAIGDCVQPRKIFEAVYEAANIALKL